MTGALLSAVLIVRDEEAVLEGCLASLRGLVDEIIVVDTGSVDTTVQIAARHGAQLFHRPWDGDFSAARNVSLDHANGSWILYIDADERLTGIDRGQIEQLLENTEAVAFRILLRPQSEMTPYLEYRVWRNDPRIRFEGFIHERVVLAIDRVAASEQRPVLDCHAMLLEHIGYEGDQRRKHLRNLPMLTRFVAENPDHLFARHHFATVLEGLDRSEESEAELWRTVEHIRERHTYDPIGVLAYSSLVERFQNTDRDFRPLLAEARQLYPDNCVLLWIEGRDLSCREEYAAALLRFDAILEISAQGPQRDRPAYARQLVGEQTHAARALCLFRLGRYAEASEAYGAAERCAPHDPSYPLKRRLALHRASSVTVR